MTNYSFTITQRHTQRKGLAFDLYVKIEGRKYRPVLGYDISEDEAHRRAIAMIARIQRKLLTPDLPVRADAHPSTTLQEAITLYWDTMKVQGRVEYVRPESLIRNHLLPFFGRSLLADLTAQDGLAYIKSRQTHGVAVGTIAKEWGTLMRILNLAVDYDLLDKNRLKVVQVEKSRPRERVATTEELCAIRDTVTPELWRVVLVALHTGLRESKILDIHDTWLVPQDDGWWMVLPKARTRFKGNAPKIPLNAIALGALVPEAQPLPTGRIFARWRDRNSLTTAWARAMHRTGIEDLHFHDLKHTFLTRLQNLHVEYEVRQWLGGHKMPGITADYSHGGEGWDTKVRNAVNQLALSYKLSYESKDSESTYVDNDGKILKDMILRRMS
jgi:integrase